MSANFPANPVVDQTHTDSRGRTWTYNGHAWVANTSETVFTDFAARLDEIANPRPANADEEVLLEDDGFVVWRNGRRMIMPAGSISLGGGSSTNRPTRDLGSVSGTVLLDVSAFSGFRLKTSGDVTLQMQGGSLSDSGEWIVLVELTSASHAVTVANSESYGIGLSDLTLQDNIFLPLRITRLVGVQYFLYEVLVPFDIVSGNVQVGSFLPGPGVVPPPPTSGTYSILHYTAGHSSYTINGVDPSTVTFGSNGDANGNFALNDAYSSNVLSVRWWLDPEDLEALNTWDTSYPNVGDNGFLGGSATAPRARTVDFTGLTDGSHNLVAQVRIKNVTNPEVIQQTVTVDNGVGSGTTPPSAPVLNSANAGANSVTLGWTPPGSGTTITSYQISYGTSSPPTRAPSSVGNTTSYSQTGLAGSQTYYFRVRGVSADGTPGVWSNILSSTTTGTGGAIRSSGVTRDAPPSRAAELCGSTFGPRVVVGGVVFPYKDQRSNASKSNPNNLAAVVRNIAPQLANKRSLYDQSVGPNQPIGHWKSTDERDQKQRGVVTAVLSYYPNPNNPSKGASAKRFPYETLISSAEVARGDYSYSYTNAALEALASGIEDALEIDLYHEGNGGWYGTYSGIIDSHIGDQRLLNASDAVWGPEIGAALRQVGVDGDRGPIIRLAFETAAMAIRDVSPKIAIGITFAAGDAEPTDGGGSADGTSGTAWNWSSWQPDVSLYDVVNVDTFGRTQGRPQLKAGRTPGSTNTDDYTFTTLNQTFDQLFDIVGTNNKAWGIGEYGPMFDDWTTGTSLPSDTIDDARAAVWWKQLWFRIKNAPPNCQRVATLNHWQAQNGGKAGTTFKFSPTHHPKFVAACLEDFEIVRS